MKQENELVTTEMRRLLMEIGLMGLGCGLQGESYSIFQLLRTVDPKAAYPLLGLAQFYILHNKMDQAEQLLSELERRKDIQGTPFAKLIQKFRALGTGLVEENQENLSLTQ